MFNMREAWILMEASTGEWIADGDNLAMVMFFSLCDDKNHNVGGNSTVSNGLIKTSIKYTSAYCKLSMIAAMVSHDHLWRCVAVSCKKWAKEKLQCVDRCE